MALQTGAPAEVTQFSGQSASSGVACGKAFLSMSGLEEIPERRLQDDEIADELNRLDSVARAARASLARQRRELGGQFTEEQRKVFDTHLLMLEDPVIEADVRGRISEKGMSLESAVKDVFQVYERLFRVVETASLRNKLSDMRDVALRLLRHCKRPAEPTPAVNMKGGVMVVRELSLNDLTEALEQGVVAIVAEGGSLSSHGAILTRAAGIPAVIGLAGFHERIRPGDDLLVDGDGGRVVLNPPPEVLSTRLDSSPAEGGPVLGQVLLRDGSEAALLAAAASPSEVRAAAGLGIADVGLYRTELPVIQRDGLPREDSLSALYAQVLKNGGQITFRLPDLDNLSQLRKLAVAGAPPEANPALGLRGIRLLLRKPELLSLQLRAILRASAGRPVRIAVPFVSQPSDLDRVHDAVRAAQQELRLEGVSAAGAVSLGAVVETPAAALLGREILERSDFALIGLDNLAQYLLAADRGHPDPEVSDGLRRVHPALLRAVGKLARLAEALGKELAVYGEAITLEGMIEALLGLGIRRFVIRPEHLRAVSARLEVSDPDGCIEKAAAASRAAALQDR